MDLKSPNLIIESIIRKTADQEKVSKIYEIKVDSKVDSLEINKCWQYRDDGIIISKFDYQEYKTTASSNEMTLHEKIKRNRVEKFVYDDSSKLISKIIEYEENGKNVETKREYIYEGDRLKRELGVQYIEDKLHEKPIKISLEVNYQYDSTNKVKGIITEINSEIGISGLKQITTVEFQYDKKQRLKKEMVFQEFQNSFQEEIGKEKHLSSVCKYIYDDLDQLKQVINFSMPDEKEYYKIELHYNNLRQIEQIEEWNNITQKEMILMNWLLSYDEEGRLKKMMKVGKEIVIEKKEYIYE